MSTSKSSETYDPAMNVAWEEVHAGAPERWVPSQVGDTLIGTYIGFETITIDDAGVAKEFRYFDIRDNDGHLWSVPNSYQIEKGLGGLIPGRVVKLTYLGEIDLGKKGHNPMKNYSVHVAK